ncbi:hypothetical protein ACXXDK_13640 [Deinococcus sp. PESE-38]
MRRAGPQHPQPHVGFVLPGAERSLRGGFFGRELVLAGAAQLPVARHTALSAQLLAVQPECTRRAAVGPPHVQRLVLQHQPSPEALEHGKEQVELFLGRGGGGRRGRGPQPQPDAALGRQGVERPAPGGAAARRAGLRLPRRRLQRRREVGREGRPARWRGGSAVSRQAVR